MRKIFSIEEEFESTANEIRLFKSPFGAGGTKKEREKALNQMQEHKQRAGIAYFNHEQNCPECKKANNGTLQMI